MKLAKDITGEVFYRLTVIRENGRKNTGRKEILWECKCCCGNIINTTKQNLSSGCTKSCGCYALDVRKNMHKTHGMSGSHLYNIWAGIKQRCLDENNNAYENYGGRGIKICEDWKNSFTSFYNDMNKGYKKGLEIDRIDNNGNYELSNCRWSNSKEQANNRRSNIILEFNGVKRNITQWSEITKISSKIIFQRINRGWSIEKSLTSPKLKNQFR